ncbi:MAG: helix-turn-helix transcriptional regulator [Solirubrobacterales bacterium]|nr:helix-turn-helix transcriptional regulator [Solirubrobacterales bacterium]
MARDSSGKQLDLLLLSALSAEPAHGYAVIEELRRRSEGFFDLPESTVYPALHRLEQSKLVDSEWAEVGGRKRRIYRLTDEGRSALRERRREWTRLRRGIGAAIGEAG